MLIKLGFVALTAANTQDALGNLLESGTLLVQPTDTNDVPINVPGGGVGGIITSAGTATLSITNGAIPAGSQIADTAQTVPANICYRITVADSTGSPITIYRKVQTNGQPLNLDTYVPNVAAQAIIQTGPQGPPGISGTGTMTHAAVTPAPDGVSTAFTVSPSGFTSTATVTFTSAPNANAELTADVIMSVPNSGSAVPAYLILYNRGLRLAPGIDYTWS